MSESSVPGIGLRAELRAYFALTTSTPLPSGISRMSVRSLRERRSSGLAAWCAGAFGLAAAAALVFVVIAHPGSPGASSSSTSYRGLTGSVGPAAANAVPGDTFIYPGVDTAKLAASGVVLRAPDGHATASVSPAQAQAAARQAAGAASGIPGPAVLAMVNLLGQQPNTCLCWVIDVPVSGGQVASPGAASPPRTALVLVDAVDGRVVATLTGHGIP